MAAALVHGTGLICALLEIANIVLAILYLGICVVCIVVHESHPFRLYFGPECRCYAKRERGISWYCLKRLKKE